MAIKNIVLNEFVNPAECLQQIVSAYTEYMIIAEQEKTQRCQIEAWEKTTITQINAQKDVLIACLERSFDERAEIFRGLFAVLDQSLTLGNNEQLAQTLNSITEIAKASPFQELANLASVRAALDNPEHKWEF